MTTQNPLAFSTEMPEKNMKKYVKLLQRNFQSIELMAPTEVRLKINRARQGVREVPKVSFVRVSRDENDAERDTQQKINSIFDRGQNMTCLSKFVSSENGGSSARPKLAICICAYNEDKGMLKDSLNGIYESLKTFQEKAGILPQQIVVIVIFDGIEKIKRGEYMEDVVTVFDEVDFNHGSILKEGEIPFEEQKIDENNIDFEPTRVSCYTRAELNKRSDNRFRSKYQNHMRIKKLQQICEKKDRPFEIDKVPAEVKQEFMRLKKQYVDAQAQRINRDYEKNRRQNNPQKKKDEQIKKQLGIKFDAYSNFKSNMEKAYVTVQQKLQRYFKSREDTSLIYPMEYVPDYEIEEEEKEDQNNEGQNLQQKEPLKLNTLLCVKHRNAGKLSSQALFFLGFCNLMNPQLCLLMDVGLRPLKNSIFEMCKFMDLNKNCGGSCGYMGLRIQRSGDEFGNSTNMDHIGDLSSFLHNQMFSVQKAQMFEYHFGHLIDKPFEAMFNFIHVLPGAFSCYRFSCLDPVSLNEYLSPVLEIKDRSLEEENRYLAEDRTLSLILKSNNFDFAYLPEAKAVVDPASSLVVMLGQRRRWINGTWFAFQHVYQHRDSISSCVAHFQFYYYKFMNAVSYVSIGMFFATLFLTVESFMDMVGINQDYTPNNINVRSCIVSIILFIYILIVGSITFLSLQVNNNDKRFQTLYYFASTFLGLYGIFVMGLMVYNIVTTFQNGFKTGLYQQAVTNPMIEPIFLVFMLGTIVIYIIHVIIAFDFRIYWQIIISTPSYFFYAPTYIHILMIYAFCKIDDFSWGTKGLDQGSNLKEFLQEENRIKKYKHLCSFLFWNIITAVLACILVENNQQSDILNARAFYMLAFSSLLFANTLFKFLLSVPYLIYHAIRRRCYVRYNEKAIRDNMAEGQRIVDAVKQNIKEKRDKFVEDKKAEIRRTYGTKISRISNIKMK